jgi:hypothetical protein
LHQHPESAVADDLVPDASMPVSQVKHVSALPESYTHVPAVTLLCDEPDVPNVNGSCTGSMLKIPTAKVHELMWLNTAWQHWENDTFSANSVLSWSAFHAQ